MTAPGPELWQAVRRNGRPPPLIEASARNSIGLRSEAERAVRSSTQCKPGAEEPPPAGAACFCCSCPCCQTSRLLPSSFADPEMCRRLEKLRLSQTQPRRVEASSYAAIRRYVALGYGIGLVAVSVLHQRDPSFHERSMSHELGRLMVYSIRRRGALQGEAHREFLKIARAS